LKERISVHPDACVWITEFGFFEGSTFDFVARYAFLFGFVFVFGDALDVTSVSRQKDFLFADETFTPSAHVIGGTTVASSPVPILRFVDVPTVWNLFVSVAYGWDVEAPTLEVVVVALVSEEFSVAQSADRGGCRKLATCQGSFGFDEIGTVFSFAGGTPFTVAGMMMKVVVIVSSIAFVAEVGFVEEPIKRITSVVVTVVFDEAKDLVRGYGSRVDEHVRRIDGKDLELVPR